MDEVNTDARRMAIRMWWRKALDRVERRKLLVEAKNMSCRAEDDDLSFSLTGEIELLHTLVP
jgi:hypothetical protein